MLDTDPKCLAVSAAGVIVVCDDNSARFFSSGGVQLAITSLSGAVVALCGASDFYLVASHAGPPFNGGQNIKLERYSIDGVCLSTLPLPLSPTADLVWMGVSDTLLATTFDSRGTLRVHSPAHNAWIPVLQNSSAYWPVGIYASELLCLVLLT